MILFLILLQVTGLLSESTVSAAPTCPDGFTVLNDKTCVKFYDTPRFYQEALDFCKQFTGGSLVSVHNAIDNRALFNLAQDYVHPIWLGLTCTESSWGTCAWEDQTGYTSDYYYFANGNPFVDIGNNVYMLMNGVYKSRWVSADGTISEFAFFCEVPTNNAPEFCPKERDGYCYTLKLDMLNEADARKVCQKDCGDLASIHSLEENNFVYNLYPYTTSLNQFRIGARTFEDGLSKYWVDGSSFDYSNLGYSNSQAGLCTSVSLYKDVVDSREWMSISCDQKMPFACKRPKNVTSCGPIPTGIPVEPTGMTYGPTPAPTIRPNDRNMCDQPQFFSESGTIYSPYYPNNYHLVYSYPTCKYIITVPRGTIAQVQFTNETYIKKSKIDFYSELEDGVAFASFTEYPPSLPFYSTTNVIKMVFTIYTDHDGPDVKWVATFGNNETMPVV